MALRLVQFVHEGGRRVAAVDDGGSARLVANVASTYELAQSAIATGKSLEATVSSLPAGPEIDLQAALSEGRVLAPIDHPDPAHLALTGTGLTHLGSAEGRDKMHKAAASAEKPTDSMRMFLMGLEGGKPKPGEVGVQPEWFFKGDGSTVVGPEAPLVSPAFALDGGEEPEIAAIYVIGPDGTPFRLGFALGNEFSDHVTERQNYLWLAHSKLRQASIGPELLVGALPGHVEGSSRIRRNGAVIWEKPFLSGEDNMSHTIANLEHHHFKYGLFRRPGDVHVHFFGTDTLSFSDGVKPEEGDTFEIEAKPFTLPLRNRLEIAKAQPFEIKAL
ncbi:FAH family protein [Pseudaminobacter sp. 19-2017]|uniref:FAH family protein n=1 Tax=Pseudaminobacter soli (ex Zhang et al. 2022) TaxID=2831468 RepID=A0A942E743_9HYPH|nr:AraD1 family protein [Pseudaminobacter soli]MBS3652151.1 FAH family protein [Pseudaminobacter soli]